MSDQELFLQAQKLSDGLTEEDLGKVVRYLAVCQAIMRALQLNLRLTTAQVAYDAIEPIIERLMIPPELLAKSNELLAPEEAV